MLTIFLSELLNTIFDIFISENFQKAIFLFWKLDFKLHCRHFFLLLLVRWLRLFAFNPFAWRRTCTAYWIPFTVLLHFVASCNKKLVSAGRIIAGAKRCLRLRPSHGSLRFFFRLVNSTSTSCMKIVFNNTIGFKVLSVNTLIMLIGFDCLLSGSKLIWHGVAVHDA